MYEHMIDGSISCLRFSNRVFQLKANSFIISRISKLPQLVFISI